MCKGEDYKINLIFFWLHSSSLALKRVKFRVAYGGHAIPEDTIERRYTRGLENFFNLYMPLVDEWTLYDNSISPEIIAMKPLNQAIKILDPILWKELYNLYNKGEKK